MAYTREVGLEFWFDFDNQTLFERTAAVDDALRRAYFNHGLTFDSIMDALRVSFARRDHPSHFVAVVQPGRSGFLDLADIQHGIMLSHLENDDGIQSAFEDFGQGVLFDSRPARPPGRRIHMMDGSRDTWVGYHRWHAFAQAAVAMGASASTWLHINRCIALAWAIQTEANPRVDHPANPDLPTARLQQLRHVWMSLPAAKLDWAFVNHPRRAPLETLFPEWRPSMGRYARVQELLRNAATDGRPMHMDDNGNERGRFWELPYAEFMALSPIYGFPLIADAGPNRGERSNLVKILRGPLTGVRRIPQMPLDRPAMAAADIQFIQEWIDADCPEN